MSYPKEAINPLSIPFIGSGNASVVTSGSVMSYKGNPVYIEVKSLGITLIFQSVFNSKYPSQIRLNPPNKFNHFWIYLDNMGKRGLSGTSEPINIATTSVTDLQGNTKQCLIDVHFQISFISEEDKDFLLHYTIFAVETDK